MSVWFVSRHQGAIEWIQKQNVKIDQFVTHLDAKKVQNNDIVIGTLPIHLAAEICAKGAKFYFLTVNVTKEQRGKELTYQQLMEQNCSIQPFYIEKC